jgi:hypothetical protein
MFIIPLYSVLAQDKNKATAVEERKFTPAQLKEDFSIMSEVFTSLHPALYEFTSKERFNSLLDSTRQRLTKEMNVLEFYKMLSPIISQLGCGHTAVGLPGKEENYSTSFLPIKLKFLGEKAYIIDNYSTSPLLKPGLEVSSINQEPMPEIVETLFSYIQTDGYSKSNKYYFLDRRFENYYGLYIAQPAAFSIEVVDKSGIKTQVKVEALKQRGRSVQKANSIQKHPLPFYMNILDSKTALMTIDLFYVDDQSKQEAYPQFLDSCFSFINQNKIQNLIIDLRQNPGGYGTWGALLYSYLAEAPFAYYKRAVVATDKALPFSKHLKLDYTKEEYEQYLKEIIRTEQGTLLWTNHENLQIQQPQKNPFKGKVYVLIGRKSFSTTAEFCAIAFSNKRAVFIGEETGGGYYHINGGDLPELTLPHSKIKFQLPMRKYELAVKEYLPKGSPTLPHYYVAQPIEDFLSNEDTELKFTLNLIKQTNKK